MENNNNMRFSQREGLKPVKSKIQVDSMDSDLRNRLWNTLDLFYWNQVQGELLLERTRGNIRIYFLLYKLWDRYFKKPIDTMDNNWSNIYREIREYFFNCQWYEVYDFIEFIANNYLDKKVNSDFREACNRILEQELTAFRFVGGKITQITSEAEISEIEEALENTKPLKSVNIHLDKAIELLSDRKLPDYRNSIKESISAVEAVCKLITKEEKATLGQALEKIKDKLHLHPALKKAFQNLYGYTSNAEGIRHALLDEPDLNFEDAKFILVSCSAFINYLINKASKTGIKI